MLIYHQLEQKVHVHYLFVGQCTDDRTMTRSIDYTRPYLIKQAVSEGIKSKNYTHDHVFG